MIRLFAVLVLAAPLMAAPVPKEVRNAGTTQGIWKLESLVAYGRPVDLGGNQHWNNQHWTIDAEGNMKTHNGPVAPGATLSYVRLVIDPKTKTLDYTYTQGNHPPAHPGTYELTADTFKVSCNLKGTGARPTTTEPGPDVYVWTLKRVKEEKK